MILLLLAASSILFLLLFYFYARQFRVVSIWTSPLPILLIFYTINYPLKAIYNIIYRPEISIENYGYLMTFANIYVALFVIAYVVLEGRSRIRTSVDKIQTILASADVQIFALSLSAILFVGYAYRIATGAFYSLGNYYERSLAENILVNCMPLQFPVAFLLFHLARFRARIYYFPAFAICAMVVYEALLTTSKLAAFNLIFLYIFISGFHGRKIRISIIAPAIIVGLLFFFYSYAARYSGIAFAGAADSETIRNIFEEMLNNFDNYYDQVISAMFDRFELLDNFSLYESRITHLDYGSYGLGSLVELINIVPRVIWNERPNMNFNVFVQAELLGYGQEATTMSIGRMGEAYLVFGFFGVFASILYAAVFNSAFNRLFINPTSSIYPIVYLNFYFNYVVHDDYFAQGIPSLIFSTMLILVLHKLAASLARGRVGELMS